MRRGAARAHLAAVQLLAAAKCSCTCSCNLRRDSFDLLPTATHSQHCGALQLEVAPTCACLC
eukprot:5995732-Pleurochrysis_carterae.AAC.1